MKSLGGNTKLMKEINRQLVLNAVYAKAPVSSAEIARLYKLQRSTVTNIVNGLLAEGYLRVAGMGQSQKSGGKPPTLLELNPEFGYIIGVELLPAEIRLVLMNFKTEILVKKRFYFKETFNSETLIAEIGRITRWLLEEQGLKENQILGMGLGISALVNYSEGIVRYSVGLHLEEFPLVQRLQLLFDFPVYLDNDANVAVLAEKWLGNARAYRNIVYMAVNEEVTGIGCGLIIDNEIYRGATLSAGELPLDLPPLKEMLSHSNISLGELPDVAGSVSWNFDVIKWLCDNPETPAAQQILQQLGEVLGSEMVRIIDFINPEAIILGGEVSRAREFILNPILKVVEAQALKVPRQAVKIKTTSFGSYAVPIGATALILNRILKPRTLKKQSQLPFIN